MKRIMLLLAILCSVGLLMGSPALSAEMDKNSEASYGKGMEVQDLNMEQISEMQRLLNERGFEIATINGEFNEETRIAIREFQGASGLQVTGTPNIETLRALAPNSEQQEFFGLTPAYGN